MLLLIGLSLTSVHLDANDNLKALQSLKIHSKEKINIQELSFGEMVYDYYQENYFSALTHLLVAEKRNALTVHEKDAELLKGVVYLSYGMLITAEELFKKLLTTKKDNRVIAQVQFYLGKTQYLNGQYDKANNNLLKSVDLLSKILKEESYIMLSQIAYDNQNEALAIDYLNKVSKKTENGKFALFNLAIFLLQEDKLKEALKLFGKIQVNEKSSEVELNLYDRMNLSLGYYFLSKKSSEKARHYLSKIRLTGVFSNRAVLALGWTYSQSGVYEKSIAYWNELVNRDLRDAANQEAVLALAFAYYQNGAKKEALETFVKAAAIYGQQLSLIDKAQTELKQALFQKWLDSRGLFGDKIFQKWARGDVPITDSKIEYYFQDITSSNEFNQYFYQFQEMSHLLLVLQRWRRQLPVFQEMLDNHKMRYERTKPKIDSRRQVLLEDNWHKQFNILSEKISVEKKIDNLWLFATPEEKEIYQSLVDMEKTFEQLSAHHMDVEEQKEQWRRIKGVLLWDIAESYGKRHHKLMKVQKQSKQALKILDERDIKLQQVEKEAFRRFSQYDGRIEKIDQTIQRLEKQVNQFKSITQNKMQDILFRNLNKRQKELDFLLAQAELSIAKIQDEAIDRILENEK